MVKKAIALLVTMVLVVAQYGAAFADIKTRLPESLETIEAYAFYGDKAMTAVEIPYGTESIGNYAFAASGVTLAVIPESVTYIGPNAFKGTHVTIRCQSGSYAYTWASEHGFPIAGEMSGEEAEQELEEISGEGLTDELLFSDADELLPTAGISDGQILADLAEINALIEEGNSLAASGNDLAEAFKANVEEFSESAPTVTEKTTSSAVTLSFGGAGIIVDRAIARASDQGVDITDCSVSEDGGLTLLTASNGQTWYMYESAGSCYVSVKRPAAASLQARAAGNDFAAYAQAAIDKISNIAGAVSDSIEAMIGQSQSLADNYKAQISLYKTRAEQYRQWCWGLSSNDPLVKQLQLGARQYDAKRAVTARWLRDVNKRLSLLTKFRTVLKRLPFISLCNSVANLIANWRELKEIEADGHPNEYDVTDEAIAVAGKMNREISSVKGYMVLEVSTSLASIAASMVMVAAAVPTLGASTVPILIVNGIFAVLGTLMENRINETMESIRTAHGKLHTSVYGWVSDEHSGKPVASAHFVVTNGSGSQVYEGDTDENGYFDVRLVPDSYSIRFTKDHYTDKKVSVILTAWDVKEKNVQMKRIGNMVTISGIICARNNLAWGLENVLVSCEGQTAYTDWYGAYTIECRQGSYITYSKGGYTTQTRYVGYDDEDWWFDPNIQM